MSLIQHDTTTNHTKSLIVLSVDNHRYRRGYKSYHLTPEINSGTKYSMSSLVYSHMFIICSTVSKQFKITRSKLQKHVVDRENGQVCSLCNSRGQHPVPSPNAKLLPSVAVPMGNARCRSYTDRLTLPQSYRGSPDIGRKSAVICSFIIIYP